MHGGQHVCSLLVQQPKQDLEEPFLQLLLVVSNVQVQNVQEHTVDLDVRLHQHPANDLLYNVLLLDTSGGRHEEQ